VATHSRASTDQSGVARRAFLFLATAVLLSLAACGGEEPTPPPTSGAGGGKLPEKCAPTSEANAAYASTTGRYCFQYLARFKLSETAPGSVVLSGPALGEGPESIEASLSVQTLGPAKGRTASQLADAELALSPGVEVARSSSTLGGEPAEVMEGLPGRTNSRQLFVVYADTGYRLILQPVDEAFPQATGDVQAVWDSVTSSFTFLP